MIGVYLFEFFVVAPFSNSRIPLTGIQQVIDSATVSDVDVQAERLVDFSIVDTLETSGFIDAVFKE